MDNPPTTKEEITLKFINNVLHILKKQKINNIEEFENVTKTELILYKKEILELINQMQNELFADNKFSKEKSQYYRRKWIKNFHLTFLRHISSELGYKWKYKTKNIARENTITSQYIYYIEKV
jgi:hypothetical protein